MEISTLKSQVDIIEIARELGIEIGKNEKALCPFHDDKVPSLQFSKRKQIATCFSSACDAGTMDAVGLVQKKKGWEMPETLKWLKEQAGVYEQEDHRAEKKESKSLSRIAVLTKYYQSSLNAIGRSIRAQEYAESRSLNPAVLGIGYSGADIGKSWNDHLKASGIEVGIMKKGRSGISIKLKYCLLFAMKNRAGQVVDVYGRSILDKKDARHFYLSGGQQGLYPGYPKLETKKLILTESLIDTASLLQQDEITKAYEILSLYGTNGFTTEHTEAISSLPALEEVVFFMDGDKAGEESIKKWAPEIKQLKAGLKISYVNTPKGEDVNSLLQGHDGKLLTHLIKERRKVEEADTLFFSTENADEKEKKSVASRTKAEESAVSSWLDQLDTRNSELLKYETVELKITVLGGIRITGLDRLKVTLKIERKGSGSVLPIRHSLDLYHAKQVDHLTELMASQLEIRSSRASQTISHLTSELEKYREQKLELLKPKAPQRYEMSEESRKEALQYLQANNLLANTSRDIKLSGIIGEEKNALIGYVVYLSRKSEKPLHVMYLGSSGSGKTHVQEGLGKLIPEEDKEEATGLSPQSLYYEGLNMKGKVFFIEDLDGAQEVLYVIRELQTKKKITKKVAVRDNRGNTKTIKVTAEGPVVISSCTTKERLYEDNANRCILLYVDQSKEQDKRVMDYMKSKSTGEIKEVDQEKIRKQLQDVQRLLRPIKVYNPYAKLIDLPAEVFKPRRSLPLLLGFIETVTFYHQYQRKLKQDAQGNKYIESSYEDIAISFDLLQDVLFSKSDELSKSTRSFLELLKRKVKKGDTFYTKVLRKELRMNASNMKRYMLELQRYDYVKIKTGNRYRGYEYEIVDYGEYEALKSSINKRLKAILLNIKGLSGSVVQSGSMGRMNQLSNSKTVGYVE